ncbi:hypothetical protein DEO72_LG9g1622 [Vigna unguiculata]|uniref:Uncharacterized protein n=1 Tax=Vigna unguiculata TaxID=3917 RepID=A0A4D6MZY4_VIGUN|nr:hypothetical protein DEO72_LG9g1622 [Vigna unguiculata]
MMGRPNDMNKLGGPEKPDESVRPNDSKKLNEPDDLNGSSGPEDPNGPGRPNDPNEPGGPKYPNRPSKPEDSDGLGWVGPTTRTGRARRPIWIGQARRS